MGLFDKLFKKESKSVQAPVQSKSFLQSLSNSNFLLNLDNSFEGLGIEGYLSNPYVYACIDQRASNLAAIPFKLMDGDREVTDSFLLKMFDNVFYGNQAISQFDFFYRLSTFLDISGNAYIWGDSATNPRELVLYDPSDVQVISSNGSVVYMIGDSKIDLKKNLLIHLANFNPNDKLSGASPSQPSALSIDTNNAGRVYNAMLMKKHTKISGIIKGTAGGIPEDLRESFKQEFMTRYGGAANAGSVMFLGGDIEYTESQMKPVDMDWSKAMEVSGKEIGMAFKVPNELLGIGKMTYENVKEAKAYFVKQCIVPQMQKILDAFNRQLVKLFGENLKLVVDFDNIESIKEYRIESRQKELQTGSMAAINLYNSGIISLNEARQLIGFDLIAFEGSDPYAEETTIDESEPVEAEQTEPEDAPDNKEDQQYNLKRAGSLRAQRLRMDKWRAGGVKSFGRAMRKEFKKQLEQVNDLLKEYEDNPNSFDAGIFTQQIDSLANNQWFESSVDLYKQQKQKLVLDIAEDQLREFEKSFKVKRTKAIDLYDQEIQDFVDRQVGEKVVMITDTTKKEIKDIVSKAIAEGKGIGEMADMIDDLYLAHIIPNRSETIARTEVISSSNFASQKAAKNLPIVVNKIWLPTPDERTRESHKAMFNRPAIGLNEQFQVPKLTKDGQLAGGFENLDYPGDPDGAANNVINCRCAIGYEDAEE